MAFLILAGKYPLFEGCQMQLCSVHIVHTGHSELHTVLTVHTSQTVQTVHTVYAVHTVHIDSCWWALLTTDNFWRPLTTTD